ncbi:hypothetical protein EDD11_004447 [Mortierella claussenii]|nr:hypothetical protein EDD11_004447 [Mortierella claussenii]
MSNPIQVDAALLQALVSQGPLAYGGAQRQQLQIPNEAASASIEIIPVESTSSKENEPRNKITPTYTKLAFQPQRKYYLEGRIIHKRKLSRKLFFLDVSLVRRKDLSLATVSSNEASASLSSSLERSAALAATTIPTTLTKSKLAIAMVTEGGGAASSNAGQGADGYDKSVWEDACSTPESTCLVDQPSTRCPHYARHRMEVIARFGIHTLSELDDLWHKVHLGSVVRVYGDIELSERTYTQQEVNVAGEINEEPSRWSVILHCLDFEVLELWQGMETFEPNPGSADMNRGGFNKSSRSDNRKRKSSELDISASTSGLETSSGGLGGQQRRGDESQPHCKFWLNSGKCNKEQCLFWHETDLVKLKVERRRWVEERIQAKRQISHHASDPHQKTTKNQHRERALYFAHWLINTFSPDFLNSGSGVLDIAGGRGDLSWELQTRQGIKSTIIEPRPGKGMRKWQRRWLLKFKADNQEQAVCAGPLATCEGTSQSAGPGGDLEEQELDDDKNLPGLGNFIPTTLTYALQMTEPTRVQAMLNDAFLESHKELVHDASIMIGLHPDQATEPIVRAALKAKKPFAIIPCCVFGRDNPHRRLPKLAPSDITENQGQEEDNQDSLTRPVTSYEDFVTWLSTLHPEIETTWLNFEGMNQVLYWRGPSSSATKTSISPTSVLALATPGS